MDGLSQNQFKKLMVDIIMQVYINMETVGCALIKLGSYANCLVTDFSLQLPSSIDEDFRWQKY